MNVNLDMNKAEAVIRSIGDVAGFLNESTDIHGFTVLSNGTTVAVYATDNYLITVKRDANSCPYAIEVHLKKKATLWGYLDAEEILATSDPDGKVPF